MVGIFWQNSPENWIFRGLKNTHIGWIEDHGASFALATHKNFGKTVTETVSSLEGELMANLR